MSTADVNSLSGMFPSLGADVIAQVLRNSNNNLERAVDTLLSMSSGDSSPPLSHPQPQFAHTGPWQMSRTTPTAAEQSWPLLQATTATTAGNSSWVNSPHQGTGISNAGCFPPPNPAPSQRPMYPPDPSRRAYQQQPFYVGRTTAQPGSPYNSRHTRDMGIAVDQGWSSFRPTGPVPSRHNPAPMRLQGQNSSSNSVGGGGGGSDGRVMASPNFGTVIKIMILLRGLPGSGKSTVARQLVGITGIICSTDDFFIVNGRYIFDPAKLGENHQKNQDKARRAMEAGMTPVIIDNTNTACWEMKPYVLMANAFGYKTEIIEPQTEWKFSVPELERRNIHGVPREILMKMLSRYERNVTVQQIISAPEPPHINNRPNTMQAPNEQYQYRNGHHGYRPSYHGHKNRLEMASSEPNQPNYRTDPRYPTQPHSGLNNPMAKTVSPQQVIHSAAASPSRPPVAASSPSDKHSLHSQGSSSLQSSDPSDLSSPSFSLWPPSPPLHKHPTGLGNAVDTEKVLPKGSSRAQVGLPCTDSSLVNSTYELSAKSSVSHDAQVNKLVNKDANSLMKHVETTSKTQQNSKASGSSSGSSSRPVPALEIKVGEDFGGDLERELCLANSPNPDRPSVSAAEATSVTDHHRLVTQESQRHHSVPEKSMPAREGDAKFHPYIETQEKYATTGIKEYDGFGTGGDTSLVSIQLSPAISSSKCSELGDEDSGSQRLGSERRDSVSTLENELADLSDPPSTPLGSLTSSDLLEPSPLTSEPPVKLPAPQGSGTKQTPVKTGVPPLSSSPVPSQPGGSNVSPPQLQLLMPSALGTDTLSPVVPQLSPPQPELSGEQPDEGTEQEENLKFLSDCFPKLKPAMMKLWCERQGGNIQAVVDMILHMPQDENDENSSYGEEVLSVTSESTGASVDTSLDESQEDVSDHVDEGPDQFEAKEPQAVDLNNENVLSEEVVRRLHLTDEQYARLLQEHMNVEEYHSRQEALRIKDQEPPQLEPALDAEGSATCSREIDGTHEDANLELRLTLSLAHQLQRMFGSITHLLPFGGEIQCEDLVVLLSERAAREIYIKWTDTLMARKVEYEVLTEAVAPSLSRKKIPSMDYHQPSREGSSFQVVSRDKKRKRSSKPELELPPLAPTGDKQKHHVHAHKRKKAWRAMPPVSQEEVDQHVKSEAERDPYTRGVLKELYERFPSVDKPVIHWHFYAHNFKYDGTVVDLLALVPSTESTDGNHPSRQAGHSHFNPTQHTTPPRNYTTVPSNPRPAAANYGNIRQQEETEYADLRAEAAVHAQLRNEAFQKASAAYAKKQGELAGYYASQGHRHMEKMKEANRRAAEITFRQKNRESPHNTLDLHMLHVDEALTALHNKLEDCPVGSQLYVITGRGSHSKGAAKLKPAVEKYLKDKKKWYTEKNPGMLEVNI